MTYCIADLQARSAALKAVSREVRASARNVMWRLALRRAVRAKLKARA